MTTFGKTTLVVIAFFCFLAEPLCQMGGFSLTDVGKYMPHAFFAMGVPTLALVLWDEFRNPTPAC